ncbi:MAG: hypothetical protein AB7I50_06905 [Vicinamibacterales bacterium]
MTYQISTATRRAKAMWLVMIMTCLYFVRISLVAGVFPLLLSSVPAGAATIVVPAGGDFQAALNEARPGDTIVLQAGAVYQARNGYTLPYKAPVTGGDADTITITTSNPAGIPAEGVRVNPALHAAAMPKLVAVGDAFAIQSEPKAHHWKFVGIEITTDGTGDAAALVLLASYVPYVDRLLMRGFTFDRCFLHPAEVSATNLVTPIATSVSKAVLGGVPDFRLTNSYVVGGSALEKFSGQTGSGMAWGAGSGPGPMLLENNYLEAFYSPLFLGGQDADPLPDRVAVIAPGATIGRVTLSAVGHLAVGQYVAFQMRPLSTPSLNTIWGVGEVTSIAGNNVTFRPLKGHEGYQDFDLPPMAGGRAQWRGEVVNDVTIRRNTIVAARPGLKYLGAQGRWPKAWLEVKASRNLTIEANVFRSDLPTTIALYPQNQNGGFPWVEVSNVVLRNNIISNALYAIGVALNASYNVQEDLSHDIQIHNNLIEGASKTDVQSGADGSRFLHALHGGRNISIVHNTVLNSGQVGMATAPARPGLLISDNIMRNGEYGWNCEAASGAGMWGSGCYAGATMTRNVIVNNRSQAARLYPLPYPPGNWFPENDAEVGWVDPASGDYSLAASSPYKGRGSNGSDPGVDMNVLRAALAGVYAPAVMPPKNVRVLE